MKTVIAIKADFEIELPLLPNFIRAKGGVAIPVEDIDTASLVAIADAWKDALLKHAGEKSNPNHETP